MQVTPEERDALNFIFSAIDDPNIVIPVLEQAGLAAAADKAGVDLSTMTRQERRAFERDLKKGAKSKKRAGVRG